MFLGMDLRNDETIIGADRGVVKARDITRQPEEERWDWEMVNGIRGKPHEPVPGSGSSHMQVRIEEGEGTTADQGQDDEADMGGDDHPGAQAPRVREEDVRNMYITDNMLKRCGPGHG